MARVFLASSSRYLQRSVAVVGGFPMTFACWFNPEDIDNNYTFMQITDSGDSSNYVELRFVNTGDKIQAVSAGPGETFAETSAGAVSGQWQHACGVFANQASRAAYLDGGNKGTNTNNDTPANLNRTAIGAARDSSPDRYLNGLIAEAAIWQAALTDVEVAMLALGASPSMVNPDKLRAYWPLIRGDNAQDVWGGMDLTNFNNVGIGDHPPQIFYSIPIFNPAASAPIIVLPPAMIATAVMPSPAIITPITRAVPVMSETAVMPVPTLSNDYIVFAPPMITSVVMPVPRVILKRGLSKAHSLTSNDIARKIT